MPQVTFRGTGQLNGPVIINKTIDVDAVQLRGLYGSKKQDVITAILGVHYPGVRINPKQIGISSK